MILMDLLSNLSFIILVITAMIILIFRDWRINAAALGLQYLANFFLVSLSWPIGLAVVKLIVGWMATAAIALTCLRQIKIKAEPETPSSLFFRGMIGLLTIIVAFILAPTIQSNIFPTVRLIILQSGVMLMALALMQLGTNADPYLTIFSLLSFMAGFEIIHAALEISTLLNSLLVVVNLGLALVGIYFITKGSESESEQEGGAD
jgi:hypothetical protein